MFDTPTHTPSILEKTRTLSMTTHIQCCTTLSLTQGVRVEVNNASALQLPIRATVIRSQN